MSLKIFDTMQEIVFLRSSFDYTFECFQCLELNSDYYFITNNYSSEFESVEAPKLEIICLEPMN